VARLPAAMGEDNERGASAWQEVADDSRALILQNQLFHSGSLQLSASCHVAHPKRDQEKSDLF
jgi:hypothetical protein